jgi:ElaB/YqjD/DUF883 family membrane-anchored ribosome-binding protein
MANTPSMPQSGSSQTREHLQDAKESLKDAASHAQQAGASAARGVGQQVQGTASNLTQKAKDAASTMGDKAREAASNVATKAEDLAGKAGEKTDNALTAVGEKMSTLAGTIRSSAPHEGVLGSTASAVADKLESSGRYLQESGVHEITEDLADVVRRHPIPSVLAVFGVGLLIGMAASRR